MKKRILILIALLVLLSGCSNVADLVNVTKENETKTQEVVIEEIDRKFDYEIALCRIDGAKIEFSELNRGDEVTIIDEDDDFYYIDNNGLILAIEKDLVRTENDKPFEEYIGYTYSGAALFSNIELTDFVTDFYKNDEVKVIDKVKGVLLVEYDGELGYMSPRVVSDSYIVTYYSKPAVTTVTPEVSQSSGGGGSSSGGGGGDTPPSPPSPPSPPASDPGESFFEFDYFVNDSYILLSFEKNDGKTEYVPNEDYESIQGKVLLDGTITYITLCDRNENVKVLESEGDNATILVNGYKGKIKKEYLKLDGDESYNEWVGYAYGGTAAFYDYNLERIKEYLSKNDEITVVDEIDGVYVVRLEDGTYGYMDAYDVSETRLKEYHYVAPAPVVETPSSNDDGGSSSGGGGGDTPPSPPTPPSPEETGSYM